MVPRRAPRSARASMAPPPAREREGVGAVHRHADGRMGLLVGLGDEVDVLVRKIRALVREALLGPGAEDDLELLDHAVATLRVRHAEALVGHGDAAAPDP